ncbi:MAG TPA: hypothetical protein VNM87_14190, partial [Candidatus Udaeobacter sp.]|nr:hypothetical protein [Candidatus Udaeobacter sp.]
AAGAMIAPLFEEHRVSADDGHTQNETAIAALDDTVIAAFHSYGAPNLVFGVARSIDGGHAWQHQFVTGFHTNVSDPCVKAGGDGRWYLSYIGSGGAGGSDFDFFVRASTDAGATFGAPVAVTSNTTFDDKPYLAASGTHLLAAYADFAFSPAKLRVVRSTNSGLSFDHDTILAVNSVGGNGACPVIGPNGVDYVFWRDSFQDSMWVSRSTDQGLTWSADRGIAEMFPLPSTMPGGFRMINLPTAAVDPLTGTLVVAFNDQRFGNPDIVSVRSTDSGLTWSAPIRVNDDVGTTAQFFPWITFDPHGNAHVCWYDRREDGFKIDVYAARTTNGGLSFEANQRVTAAAYTPVLPWDTTVPFIGDYNGISANSTTVFPCYQDAREGNQDVYVALLPSGSTTGLAGGAPPAGQATLLGTPNPFAGRVLLRAHGRGGAPVTIVTAVGRRVRMLELGGDGTATWDGRDDQGVELPRGVYFARLGNGDQGSAESPASGIRLVKTD